MGGASPSLSPTSTSTRRKPAAAADFPFSDASRVAQLVLDWGVLSDAALLRPTCSTECLGCADAKNR
uniref:Uncharacterized protein n=1 Tax=Oryza barthii TaxID=65489 RepID=A0A0D3GF26_9ORYZ